MIAVVDTEVPRQSERSDWRALERLLDEVASDSSRDSVPLLVKIAAWYIGLRLFRLLQDAYFYLQDPTELGKEYHRPLLKKLIGIGERLATASKRQERDALPAGYDTDDILANIQFLEDCELTCTRTCPKKSAGESCANALASSVDWRDLTHVARPSFLNRFSRSVSKPKPRVRLRASDFVEA